MRYFFHIGYHGTAYHGWQRHANIVTVQQVLELTLKKVLKTPIAIHGCGRTDAGVHASQYFFHADIEPQWDYDLAFRLNKTLPAAIAIFDILPMKGLPHARFDATQRTYNYFLHTYKHPFLNQLSAMYVLPNLRIDEMRKALTLLTQYSNYAAFCTSPAKHNHTICHVTEAKICINDKGDKIRFQISANRFLSRMIRIIMARLLKIGQGKLSIDEFEDYFLNIHQAIDVVPAQPQGLYLSKIEYPYLDIQPRTDFLNELIWQ
ncbi:MAG: tRNA pseudouridine(38-40) synthase TruA [Sphingobacteriales bacterium]|nr:MAG: tRNA pseudouridine(38-40) synthase TruA [Sphingobacteriales bacterium]TAF78568.1 MAG: tRNA pseudouridine(38-40) synthase TruA [Sphingobacteriales bacterium]